MQAKKSLLNSLIPLVFCFLSLLNGQAWAGQTVVLIHGYVSSGAYWYNTGIVPTLQYAGWQAGGELLPQGSIPAVPPPSVTGNYSYTVSLPSLAPLAVQADFLRTYVQFLLQRHPQNEIILVGHSAGGVVARWLMVSTPKLPIRALISIATPHLGTEWSELGLFVTQTPLSWMTPWVGLGFVNQSEGLFYDMLPETSGSTLFWLNRQPHPPASYISVIRLDSAIGDGITPAFSQDMNYVAALAGHSQVVLSWGEHSLNPLDGVLLVDLLMKIH